MNTNTLAEFDRVRRNTRPAQLQKFDEQLEERIRFYATQPKEVISKRIEELEREWDIERVIETQAPSLALAGVLLGLTVSRKWLFLSAGVLGFLIQHAVQGWCPPIPLFRKLGLRTQCEIDREKYALKFLRGDFTKLSNPPLSSELAYAVAN